MAKVDLQLLGTRVELDVPRSCLDPYRRMFGRFADSSGTAPAAARVSVRVRADDTAHEVCFDADGRRDEVSFETEIEALGFVYGRLLDLVTRRAAGLLCVHAAALARDDCGVLLAAPSQHGKSTLALALAARGFRLLSDEVGVVRRDSLQVLPFPLAVGCRPGTHRLLGDEGLRKARVAEVGRVDKLLLCPVEGDDDGPVRLRSVFFLEPREGPRGRRRRYRIVLAPWSGRLLAPLARVEGVAAVRADPATRSLTLEVDDGVWLAPAVEGLLERYGVMALSVEDLDAPVPDFGSEPVLTALRTSRGVMGLLRHLRGFGAAEELARSHPAGFGGLVADLGQSLRSVGFFRLTPGRLDSLVDAIEATLDEGSSAALESAAGD